MCQADSTLMPALAASVLLLLSACSPALYPPYRDYAIRSNPKVLEFRIEDAMVTAGWTRVPGVVHNVIATNERQVRHWGIYSVVVSMEAIPMGGGYVRVLVHPYRQYVWGTRSKIAFLNGTIRRSVLRDLDSAMAAESLIAVGSGVSRDNEKTR